jgi:hypothetical protein
MMTPTAPRLWPDSTVAILATGPSLTQEDCDWIRGKCRVVAINDAHRLAPWADVLYSSDRRWWSYYKGVPEFQGLKFGIGSGVGKSNPFMKLAGVTVLRNSGYHGLQTKPDGLMNGRNSGYAAINLAVHFGAKRIILLGYNMSYRGGKAHFFGDHPAPLPQSAGLYPGFRRNFETLVEPLKKRGISVINCTEQTSLMAFPLGKLRDVLTETAVAA